MLPGMEATRTVTVVHPELSSDDAKRYAGKWVLLRASRGAASAASHAPARSSKKIAPLCAYYEYDAGPWLRLVLTTPRGECEISGLIDSGAPFSVVPLWVARDLGIEDQLQADGA